MVMPVLVLRKARTSSDHVLFERSSIEEVAAGISWRKKRTQLLYF